MVVLVDSCGLPWRQEELETFARRVLERAQAEPGTLNLRCAPDVVMATLNEQYRGKQGPTDVLSFEGEQTVEGRHIGDIVISLDTARRQAREAGSSFEQEVRTLIVHGVLHCLGHDHESDRGEMLELQERLLNSLEAVPPWKCLESQP